MFCQSYVVNLTIKVCWTVCFLSAILYIVYDITNGCFQLLPKPLYVSFCKVSSTISNVITYSFLNYDQ